MTSPPTPTSPPRTASPRTARAINDRTALELLAEQGPLTAGQLREHTGLSRPSVAELLDRLGRDGLVTVVGEAGTKRRGPNARLYGLVADRAHVAALDVRTGGVTFSLADLTGRTVARHALPAGSADPGGIVAGVRDALRRTAHDAGVRVLHHAVMGAPGLADPATGALRALGALPGWHAELLEELRSRLPGPVLLENEVNLAAIAEHRRGAVRDRDSFVLVWLGHGVGAGVVLDGRLRRGASGGAGELGFLPVPGTGGLPSAVDCADGLHALASASAVGALARDHGLADGADGTAGSAGEGGADGVTAPPGGMAAIPEEVAVAEAAVRRAARAAGPAGAAPVEATGRAAAAFLDALSEPIALAVAAVAALLDPGCVVLGGEVGRAGGGALAGRVQCRLAALSPLATEVRAATVAGNPVLSGGLLTALDAARRQLFDTTGADRGPRAGQRRLVR